MPTGYDPVSDGNSKEQSKSLWFNVPKSLMFTFIFMSVSALTATGLFIWWRYNWGNGIVAPWELSTSGPSKHLFVWHPILMMVAFVLLYTHGAATYRLLKNSNRTCVKLVHGTILFMALLLSYAGVYAVWLNKDLRDNTIWPHLRTLHAWIGAGIVILFTLQWIGGFLFLLVVQWTSFNISCLVGCVRRVHARLGPMFGLWSAAAILTGLTQFARGAFAEMTSETLVVNAMGLLVLFTLSLLYLILQADFNEELCTESTNSSGSNTDEKIK